MWDVIIVGGSNAGLSAALTLGRARRHVLVCDTGQPVNAPAHESHGFFTRDGTPPAELLRIGREQLRPYTTVELRQIAVTDATRDGDGFAVALADGTEEHARTLLLATGAAPEFPPIAGFAERWGEGINQCPYCHGWEVRDLPLAALGNGDMGFHYGTLIRNWSRDLVLLTDGPATFTEAQRRTLAALEIPVREEKIARLEGPGRTLERIVFADGSVLPRAGLFAGPDWRQSSPLAERLGCALTETGAVRVDEQKRTSVPGVYAAGDIARLPWLHLPSAVADGAVTGAMVNHALVHADLPH